MSKHLTSAELYRIVRCSSPFPPKSINWSLMRTDLILYSPSFLNSIACDCLELITTTAISRFTYSIVPICACCYVKKCKDRAFTCQNKPGPHKHRGVALQKEKSAFKTNLEKRARPMNLKSQDRNKKREPSTSLPCRDCVAQLGTGPKNKNP